MSCDTIREEVGTREAAKAHCTPPFSARLYLSDGAAKRYEEGVVRALMPT